VEIKRTSERAVMIRAPMATAEFTIRNLAPLTHTNIFLVSNWQIINKFVGSHGAAGAW
jgi:hypothetical protein